MAPRELFVDAIVARAAAAGLSPTRELAGQLADYIEILAKWNRKINLTSLPVDPPTDAAIDRLVIEPLLAASAVRDADRVAVDAGSGGGSPALPLALARPALQMVLVESRTRKASFLREAIRHLGLGHVTVENCRAEDLAGRSELSGCVDVVTMRAVRPDVELVSSLVRLLRPGGRLIFFGDVDLSHVGQAFAVERVELATGGCLTIGRGG